MGKNLCSDYRIATSNPKTVLGLPEVKLGILPGTYIYIHTYSYLRANI